VAGTLLAPLFFKFFKHSLQFFVCVLIPEQHLKDEFFESLLVTMVFLFLLMLSAATDDDDDDEEEEEVDGVSLVIGAKSWRYLIKYFQNGLAWDKH
jgi:hypothetical protein